MSLRTATFSLALCATLAASACDNQDDPAPAAADDRAEQATDALSHARKPQWGECPEGFAAKCARLEVPLDWTRSRGPKIEVLVSRLPARSGQSKGQLWLLQGGPGGSGAVFSQIADTVFGAYRDDFDLMVLEHRGVGESTRLSCPDQEADDSEGGLEITAGEFSACLTALTDEWGDGLADFSITQAARDLAHAIEVTRSPLKKVHVYGVSYGTLWAQRFLQVAPLHAQAVVLDSVLPPNQISVFDFDKQFDVVGEDLAALCAEDALCASKLGDNPWTLIHDTLHSLDDGHCAELGVPTGLMQALGAVAVGNMGLRRHLFPVYYRLARCNEDDRVVLNHYLGTLLGLLTSGPADRNFSPLLQMNIAFAEINGHAVPSIAQVNEVCTEAATCPQFSMFLRPLYDQWPVYEGDRYFQRWFQPIVPVLALNGDLDPQTPWQQASRVESHLYFPWQHYVQIPYAPHVATDRSPVNDPTARPCGAQIMKSFLDRPYNPLNVECLDDLAPVAFDLPDGEAAFYFGQNDEWENSAYGRKSSASTRPVDFSQLNQLLRRLPAEEVAKRLRAAPLP